LRPAGSGYRRYPERNPFGMATATEFSLPQGDATFIATIENAECNRYITTWAAEVVDGDVPQDMQSFHSKNELDKLMLLSDIVRDIQRRMLSKRSASTISGRRPTRG
jgi:hypothetical protein